MQAKLCCFEEVTFRRLFFRTFWRVETTSHIFANIASHTAQFASQWHRILSRSQLERSGRSLHRFRRRQARTRRPPSRRGFLARRSPSPTSPPKSSICSRPTTQRSRQPRMRWQSKKPTVRRRMSSGRLSQRTTACAPSTTTRAAAATVASASETLVL